MTRLSFLSVTPLPHHGKPYLGISTIEIHFGTLPLSTLRDNASSGSICDSGVNAGKILAQKHKDKWGQRRV